jgi:septal ring factor EnvC (AmiA/AmiB activator)
MYEKIKVLFANPTYRYFIIGGIGGLVLACIGYIFYQPSGADHQRTINTVERAQEQQRESLELNRSIQRSIERVSDLTRETGERIDRSQEYNQQINDRIEQSQRGLSEARSYLEQNTILFRRIEEQSRERQENYQTTTDATKPIPDGRSGDNYWSGNSSMNER